MKGVLTAHQTKTGIVQGQHLHVSLPWKPSSINQKQQEGNLNSHSQVIMMHLSLRMAASVFAAKGQETRGVLFRILPATVKRYVGCPQRWHQG